MNRNSIINNSTDGLVSAYQRTAITGAGIAMVVDTGGSIGIGVMRVPSWREVQFEKPQIEPDIPTVQPAAPDLAYEMVSAPEFKELVERGLKDLDEGRYSNLEDVKRRLGDV